nr:G protein-coupled receptor [Proales similis]
MNSSDSATVTNFVKFYGFGILDISGITCNLLILCIIRPWKLRYHRSKWALSFNPGANRNQLGLSFDTSVYICLIATSDLMIALLDSFRRDWLRSLIGTNPIITNNLFCKLFQVLFHFFVSLSPWSQILLSLERLSVMRQSAAICQRIIKSDSGFASLSPRPFKITQKRSIRRVALICVMSFMFNSHLFFTSYFETGRGQCAKYSAELKRYSSYLWLCFMLFNQLVPFSVILCVNSLTFRFLRRCNILKYGKNRQLRPSRVTSMVLVCSTMFLALNLPISVFIIVKQSKPEILQSHSGQLIQNVFTQLYFLTLSTDFFVYLMFNRKFLRRFCSLTKRPAHVLAYHLVPIREDIRQN